ncbi:class I SAM-dependent methyltransferase [Jiangella alba]|uniref:Methyltransferase domain-containing protein n=1 Tax=Jiangella alba TaxID=561176 RepID=A0A1H5H6U8_9ACTN|nr:class I SAM-dependent methyltransferase [Jiangella alba]SEE23722.1 Methyltransferase domain-containing protein [Jiangella alba]
MAAALGLVAAVTALAGGTDVAIAALGLLLTGLLLLVIDVRRRQGELGNRLKKMAQRQLVDLRRTERLQHLPSEVESASRRSLAALTDEFQLAVGRMETAGTSTLTGLAQERLAAAERHVEVLGHLADVPTTAKGVTAASEAIASLRHDVLGNLEDANRENKRQQVALRQRVDKLAYEPVRQVQALMQLMNRIDPRAPLPATGGWAMEPSALLRLVQLVDDTRPGLIVECGSGASTLWLAYALEALGGSGRVVALEHDEHYAEETRHLLRDHKLTDVAEVRHAPLAEVELGDQVFNWYQPESIQDLAGIDLLLVDGPPRASGPRARYPAVPLLGSRLAPVARVVLDDVDRPEEQEAAEAWLAEVPGLTRDTAGTDRSAVFAYRRPK